MGVALLVADTLWMVWTEHSLKEKRNCAILEGIFQEEVSHTKTGRQSEEEFLTELLVRVVLKWAGLW